MRKKILIVGPGTKTSNGGIAEVTKQMLGSDILREDFRLYEYPSYKEGNKISRFIYGVKRILKFQFEARNYDAVHVQMTSKGSALRKSYYIKKAKKMGKKVFVQIHSTDFFLDTMSEKRKKKMKKTLKMADKVLVLSDGFADRIESEFGLENTEVLPNGIAPYKYSYNPAADKKKLLFLGKIREDKGCFKIIYALKLLKDAYGLEPECVISGSGNIQEVQEEAEQLELKNISFTGWIDGDEKTRLLKNSGVLLMPSYHEGFPMSILEGMASGCYIITSDVGACSEMAEGSVVMPGDEKSLADAIKHVIYMPEDEYVAALLKNKNKIDNVYNIDKVHKMLLDMYNDAFCN